MATRAVTEELLRDLRRRIAAIEDETPRLRQVEAETPSHGENATGSTLLREHGRPVEGLRHARAERVSTGDGSADRLLGGGLPLAAQLASQPGAPAVVFVTAHAWHALEAFDR